MFTFVLKKIKDGKKLVLSREASVETITKNGVRTVHGANLEVNEYGSPLFGDFFFLYYWFSRIPRFFWNYN